MITYVFYVETLDAGNSIALVEADTIQEALKEVLARIDEDNHIIEIRYTTIAAMAKVEGYSET